MGRYNRSKGDRYTSSKNNTRQGINVYIAAILMALAALGGFYAERLVDGEISLPTLTLSKELTEPDNPDPGLTIPKIAQESAGTETQTENIETLPQPEAVIILPELSSSDAAVRAALSEVSPELTPWLSSEELIKSYLAIANDFSQGIRIAKHLRFLKLQQAFGVDSQISGVFMSKSGYQRYDKLAKAIDAIDVPKLLSVYKKFRPLLLEAFAEFSYPESHTLEDIFNTAAAQILAAPAIDTPIAVVNSAVNYKFADPQLESLNPVHKQMLRMGPENTRIIQNKLRTLTEELGKLDCTNLDC